MTNPTQERLKKFWIENGAKEDQNGTAFYHLPNGFTPGWDDHFDSPCSRNVPLEVLVDLWKARCEAGDRTEEFPWETWNGWFGLTGAELRLALCRALGLEG